MPIEVDSEIRVFSQDEFHTMAHRVLGITFGIHNEFGRLLDEQIYKQALLRRLEDAGLVPVRREVQITLRFGDFEKRLFMDVLVDSGLMVEAKTAETLTNSHYSQTLQYLLLTGMRHGLLLNLRPELVKHQFVSTTLDQGERRRFTVFDSEWQNIHEPSRWLRERFVQLLADWGAFLQISLYREAIFHWLGGPERALRRIPIFDGDVPLGTDEVCLLTDDTAIALTALKDGQRQMQDHLQRFLRHTRLNGIQWINLAHHEIEFRSLLRSGRMMEAE